MPVPLRAHTSAHQAMAAGCDDPLILYLHAQASLRPDKLSNADSIRDVQKAADAWTSSQYSPFRQATAVLRTAQNQGKAKPPITAEDKAAIRRAVDQMLDLFARSVQEDPRGKFWEERWFDTLKDMRSQYQQAGDSLKEAYDRIDARLVQTPEVESLRLSLVGNFEISWGWEGNPQAADQELNGLLDRLFTKTSDTVNAADREAVVNVVAARTGKGKEDASKIVDRWQQSYQQAKEQYEKAKEVAAQKAREAGDVAAHNISHVAFWTFAAMLVGLGSAI